MAEENAVTVFLGDLQGEAEARVRSGAYGSISEVLRAGLQSLKREEQAARLSPHHKVAQALADPRESIPASEVFAELRAYHRSRSAGDKLGG